MLWFFFFFLMTGNALLFFLLNGNALLCLYKTCQKRCKRVDQTTLAHQPKGWTKRHSLAMHAEPVKYGPQSSTRVKKQPISWAASHAQ